MKPDHTLDWGSGFLTKEDALPVAHIAKVCGFKGCEEAERYVRAELIREEREAYWKVQPQASSWWNPEQLPYHDHVFSKITGECMWRNCPAKREPDGDPA